MKDTLLYLLQHIVDNPADIVIDEQENVAGKLFVIHVNSADMGKVIGKSGRIIRALRDIIKLIATKQNSFVDVVLAEEKVSDKSDK